MNHKQEKAKLMSEAALLRTKIELSYVRASRRANRAAKSWRGRGQDLLLGLAPYFSAAARSPRLVTELISLVTALLVTKEQRSQKLLKKKKGKNLTSSSSSSSSS